MRSLLLIVGVVGVISLTACHSGHSCHHGHHGVLKKGEKYSPVTVVINYGKNKTKKSIKVDFSLNMTVLQALQSVAKVETYVKGKYVFVTSIDDVKGKRGVMAWYYNINNHPTGKLAFSKKVHPTDVIEWRYVKDICSKTVDK